jgi:hypothetical protein
MVELACPETCHYLSAARDQAVLREREFQSRELARGDSGVIPGSGLQQRLIPLVCVIDGAIVETLREKFRDLSDVEALLAVENAIQNLETESSGLIYHHRDNSPRVELLSEEIRSRMSRISEESSERERLTRSDMIAALKYVRFRIQLHVKRAEGDPGHSGSFLSWACLLYPWPEKATRPLVV